MKEITIRNNVDVLGKNGRKMTGDFNFNTALLTLIYRQDHFCDGTGEYFNKYCRNGIVKKILTRIGELLNENN